MKKLLISLISLALVLAFAGCDAQPSQSAQPSQKVTQAPTETPDTAEVWNMPQEVYKDLEEFELDESKTHSKGDIEFFLAQENEQYALYISQQITCVALVHKASGEAWYSCGTNKYSPLSVLNVTGKVCGVTREFNGSTHGVQLMNDAIACQSNILPYYFTKNSNGGLRVQYIVGELSYYKLPAIMPVEVCDWLEDKAQEIYLAINTDGNGQMLNITQQQMMEKARELYGYEALYAVNPTMPKSIYTQLNKEKFDNASESQKETFKSFVPGVSMLGDETMAVQKMKFNQQQGPSMEALFALWFNQHKSQPQYASYSSIEQLIQAWNRQYDAGRVLVAVAFDYTLTSDGLEVQIQTPIYDTDQFSVEVDAFGMQSDLGLGHFNFEKAQDGMSATVKYNG